MAYMQSFGALPSKVDIRDYVASVTGDVEYPEEFELKMCSVKNQGSVGSCVAHSISEVVEYFNKVQTGEFVRMSTGYIYGNRVGMDYDGEGMFTSDALNNTVKYGDVPNDLFNVNVEVPAAINLFNQKSFELAPEAFPNRFSSYFRLTSQAAIKANLIQNGPVVFAIKWYNSYKVVNGLLVRDTSDNSISGHHCMVIYGWNKQGWKIQNSWGTSWGNQGRAILPYDTKLSEAYGVIDDIYEGATDARIQQLESMNTELTARIEELNLTLATIQDAYAEQTKQIVSIRQQLNHLEQTSAEDKETIDNLEAEKSRLQEEFNQIYQAHKDLKESYEENQAELLEYEKQIEDQKKTIDILETELIEIKKPYQNLNKILVKIINWFANLFKKKN